MAFAAYRVVGFIAADLDLFAAVDGLAVLYAERHGGFPFAEPADRFHFFNFVCVDQHIFAAFEQIVLEIVFEPEGHNRNVQLVDDPHQLEDAVLA